MPRTIFAPVALLLLFTAPALAGTEPIVTTDLLRVRTVEHIDVSGDGSIAVFAVASIGRKVMDDRAKDDPRQPWTEYENQSHIFVLDLADLDAVPRQLTFGDRHDVAPVLSPQGRRIAFVRKSQEKDEAGQRKPQVWVMNLDGGEAWPVTRLEHGASQPRWSPEGRSLLAHGRVPAAELDGDPPWPTERPGRAGSIGSGAAPPAGDSTSADPPRPDGSLASIQGWLDANAAEGDPVVLNRLDFQDEQALRGAMKFVQLFLVDPERDGDEPVAITKEHFDHLDARFLGPQGRIVYVTKKPIDQHPDRVVQQTLWTVNADGSDDRLLLSVDGLSLRSPQPSFDGSMLAFAARPIDEPTDRQWQLGLITLAPQGDRVPIWLTDPQIFDASVRSVAWLPAQSAILFNTALRGGFPLMTTSPGLLEPGLMVDEVQGMPAGVHRFAAGGGTLVYTVSTPANPCVLKVWDGRGDREVFDLNHWLLDKELAVPREGWITRADGTKVQYWLMEPTDRQPGKVYPLALQIHGGPSGMWGPGERTMWHEFQLLCSFGYGVVYCNPRGSSGYGYAFQRANFQNWGTGPAGDVLAVVDQAMLQEWVDPQRLVVTGGSYAGYLTAWIIGNDHRFKAAVAQRGVYDLATFFGEGNAWRLLPWEMGGHPWDGRMRPVLQRESPFSYVNRIRTPLLIMHASRDLRTGVSQSEMLYRALKVLERPVEYVRYPGAGHDLSRTGKPHQRMDRLNRIIEFFGRYVDDLPPAPRVDGE